MSSPVACYAHVPGLSLELGADLRIGDWTLGALPFESWLALEDPAMGFVERRYEAVAPVFLQTTIKAGDDTDPLALEPALLAAARRVSHALLFTHWRALPDPGRSARYFARTDGEASTRAFGINERELLLIAHPPYVTIGDEDRTAFTRIFERLSAVNAGDETPELLRLVETIRRAYRPDRSLLDLVVHFVAVHEDVLNRASNRPLGVTFARRAAALFCPEFDRMGEWREMFEQMYDARSGALHGRDPSAELDWLAGRFTDIERFLLFACYRSCCQLAAVIHADGAVETGIDRLVEQLDRAAGEASAHLHLHAGLETDWLRQ